MGKTCKTLWWFIKHIVAGLNIFAVEVSVHKNIRHKKVSVHKNECQSKARGNANPGDNKTLYHDIIPSNYLTSTVNAYLVFC